MAPTAAHDHHQALAAAGLAPPDTGTPGTQPFRVRTYRHPALARPVVRHVADPVAPAEDAALAHLGFGPAQPGSPLTRGHADTALRYPYWALVHDPDHATTALAVTRRLEAAARRAATKPGHAHTDYAEIAARLPARHAAPMWDEAARAFTAAERRTYAQRCFSTARAAERALPEPPDLESVRATYLEFSLVGAVGVREVKEYVEDLGARHGPARAHDGLRDLALRRCRGGVAPWVDLVAQVGTWARRAGRDHKADRRDLLRDLLELPATAQAEDGFWTKNAAAITEHAREDPAIRAALLRLAEGTIRADPEYWVPLLVDGRAVDHLAATGEHGEAAQWLERIVTAAIHDPWRGQPDNAVLTLVAPLAERLRADAVPVRVWTELRQGHRLLRFALLDTAVGERVPVDEGGAKADIPSLLSGRRTDLPLGPHGYAPLLADPRHADTVAALVDRSVSHHGAYGLWTVPPLRPLAEARLAEHIAELHAGLHTARAALARLVGVDPRCWTAAPHLAEGVRGAEAHAVLARTLRRGIIDELHIPEQKRIIQTSRPRDWPKGTAGHAQLLELHTSIYPDDGVMGTGAPMLGAVLDDGNPALSGEGDSTALSGESETLDPPGEPEGTGDTRSISFTSIVLRRGAPRSADDVIEVRKDDPPGRWCPPGADPADVVVRDRSHRYRGNPRLEIVDRSGEREEILWSVRMDVLPHNLTWRDADGSTEPLRPEYVAHLVPRDPDSSARLRATTEDAAHALIRTADAEIGTRSRYDRTQLPETRAEVERLLPGVDPRLADGVTGLVREAANLGKDLASLRARIS
ncbi:hypothetical protein CLV63_11057 [Murinocardiopsis flavida]|uniref:Uncharacterized protein n=1 Tax=Murinocardiopsis flavida TaxID=645275 RepID=A0A2P8DHQ8_9ACTN|nr:hypothetical protein [Murinocardiopsis flavida]PSK96760.1 hypothetical protein CLV63_11057 [Murinocardiopsis flavida]